MRYLTPEEKIVRFLRWITLFTGIMALCAVVCSALFVWTCLVAVGDFAETLRGLEGM